MRKLFTFLMSLLFVGSVFSTEVLKATFDFTSEENVWGFPTDSKNKATERTVFTNDTMSIVLEAPTGYCFYPAYGYLLFGKGGATLELPAFNWKTTKIVVTGNGAASANVVQNIFVNGSAVSSETIGAKEVNTYLIAEDYQDAGNVYVLTVLSKHNSQVTLIDVYGEEDGVTTGIEKVENSSKVQKVIVNGQLLIKKDNRVYTITGVRLQ